MATMKLTVSLELGIYERVPMNPAAPSGFTNFVVAKSGHSHSYSYRQASNRPGAYIYANKIDEYASDINEQEHVNSHRSRRCWEPRKTINQGN
jgi:hypothetical protein